MTVDIRPPFKADVGELSVALARAFHDDPVMMWLLPNVVHRARALPRMFATMSRHHFLAGGGAEVALQDDAIGGVALWDPPGRWKTPPREKWRMKPAFALAFRSRIPPAQKVADMMKEHHPEEPHWYLAVIGTDPSVRGKGFGQALMTSRLKRVDAEHAPAYLESTKWDNVPYYQRFGFEVTGEIELPNSGPRLWSMWRTAR
jgi:ribosomal protein S18 acetylase RimI-like enzyme